MPQAWACYDGCINMRAGVIVLPDEAVLSNYEGTGGLGFVALRVGQPNECDLNEFVLRVYPDEPVNLKVHKPLKRPISYWD